MYNKAILLLLSLTSLLFAGCLTDHLNNNSSIRMTFEYKGNSNQEIMSKDIQSATLLIYGSSDDLIKIQPLTKAEFESPKGVIVNLELENKYTIVCWTNLNENATINNRENLNDATLSILKTAGTEKMYYGVETLEVDAENCSKETAVVMNIYPSFMELNVRVVGPEVLPKVSILGFKSLYGITGKPLSDSKSIKYSPIVVNNNLTFSTSLNVLRPISFENTAIELAIGDDDLFLLDLNKYVKDKYPTLHLNSNKEISIDILIEYKVSDEIEVIISIPNWDDIDTSVSVN